ncbi:28S rRNA (cytosine-C(5))-methyltransferase [Bicyclus anynana]|uniref:28S rRNA (Cytosine-C(5))-methyltransferase n=1 Tax=Bicyclus anynana TaxID=110368 RepID=A0A6J1NWC5_BICAN|nr:28S rRNA (cytosine-C(5))-methyltransferase [Bicyclus anynana]
MFEHSVKVPRHFKIAANIVQKVFEEGGSVKTLLYDNKLKHFRTNVLYALINESIKHAVDIKNMFESTGILENEPRLDPWLARVLTAELIYGKKSLPGKSKPEQTILSYKERFEKYTEAQGDQKSKDVRRPRYVRINTNLLTTSDAIRAFQDDGYKFIRCTSGSYNDYLQQIQSLTEYDFTQDYHVKTIFVFSPTTKLHEHDLYLENKIILQDKATALPVHLLAPPPGSVVLDMCAAPGMKTTQLAAYLRNQGKIYAVERNEKRYETLCQYVEATGSKCVETLHKDTLEIRRGDLDEVEYILLDPSCSGSGMELSVHNYIDETRLAKLTSLQEKFLKHAMNAFPNAKRIVYSTCSIFPEENERVITNIVKASRAKWRVKDVKELLKDQWNNFGSGMYGSMGTRCLYAKPDSDFTTGFFLAVLDRDSKDKETLEDDHKVAKMALKLEDITKQHKDGKDVTIIQVKDENISENEVAKNSKKKKHKDIESTVNIEQSELLSEDVNDESNILKGKKKKRKKAIETSEISRDVYENQENDDKADTNTKTSENSQISLNYIENKNEIEIPKKKKKKDKQPINYPTEAEKGIVSEMLLNNDEVTQKKMKKKSKNLDNELLEPVTEVIEDIPSKIEEENSKKLNKRKKQKEISISFENNEEEINQSNENNKIIQVSVEDTYNNEAPNEVPKTKKKKHKKEIEKPIDSAIVIDDGIGETTKKSKKRKKDGENMNYDLTEDSEVVGIKDKNGIKKGKGDTDVIVTEISQSCEVPKKKKKKRVSENS